MNTPAAAIAQRTIVRNPFEMRVSFSDSELEQFRNAALARQSLKNTYSHLVTDKRIMQRDNVETHMIGLLGEFAIARLVHGVVDTSTYLSGDTDKDFSIYGVSVEVKTLQGYLTFKNPEDFKSDVAALVIYNRRNYSSVWVQGWIARKDFADHAFTDNFGYGDRQCVQPADLLPISTLKTYCLTTSQQRWLLSQMKSSRNMASLV